MKKFHKSISFFLAASVVLTMFCLSGCNKNETSETETSSSSITENTTVESTTESTTTESTTESTTVESTTAESTTESETSESTTAETSESTESTTEPSSTFAPDEGSSSGVKVHWDSYDPVMEPLQKQVVNWFYGKPTYEFIPSPDYGKVHFFLGSNNNRNANVTNTYGCIDDSGRVICAPFFNTYHEIKSMEDVGSILIKHMDANDPASKKSDLIYQDIAFLSDDGSVFSGFGYNDFFLKNGLIQFIKFTEKGIRVTPFDPKTGAEGKSYDLLVTFNKSLDSMRFESVIMERYILCTLNYWVDSDDPYAENETVLIDGKSGKIIPTSNNQYVFSGSLLKEECPEGEDPWNTGVLNTYTITDFNGKTLWSGKYYSFEKAAMDRILFRSSDGYDLFDQNGNLIGSVKEGTEPIGNGKIEYWHFDDGKLYCHARYNVERTITFDKYLNVLDSKDDETILLNRVHVNYTTTIDGESVINLKNEKTSRDFSTGGMNVVEVTEAADLLLIIGNTYDSATDVSTYKYIFVDPEDFHEVTTLESRSFPNEFIGCFDHSIVVDTGKTLKLISTPDFQVIKEIPASDGFEVIGWLEEEKKYLGLRTKSRSVSDDQETYRDYKLTEILDPSTGESFFTTKPAEEYIRQLGYSTTIHDGKIYNLGYDTTPSMVIDKDGQILFLWNSFETGEEHYTWYPWDEEPDTP